MDGILRIIDENYYSNPTKIAIISGTEELSYRNLNYGSLSFANYLDQSGIGPQQKILMRGKSVIATWCAFFGSMVHRCVLVIVDETLPVQDLKDISDRYHDIALVISDNERDDCIAKRISFDELKEICKRGYIGQHTRLEDINKDDITNIIYTTGTTGKAKGVCWSYSYLWHSNFLPGAIPFSEKTFAVLVGKLNHTFGLGMGLSILAHNGTFAQFDGLSDVNNFYNQLSEYQMNTIVIPPSAMTYLFLVAYDKIKSFSKNIKLIELAGERLTKIAQTQILNTFPKARTFVSYGSTEVGHIGAYEFSKDGANEQRVLKIENEPKIAFFDENKENIIEATKENPAFIGVKMPFKIPGYYNEGHLNEILLHDGYAVTNDLGYIENGFLCLYGRSGDVINSGGLKTNPLEVEEIAFDSGMIKDCVCYGTSDMVFGKLVTLDIVIKNNYCKKEFMKYLKENLVKHSVPKIINIVDAVRRIESGCSKVDRKYYRNK